MSIEEYVAHARANSIATFAIVKGGKWFERGKMGWWGLVSNKGDKGEWCNKIHTLLGDLPDGTRESSCIMIIGFTGYEKEV